MEKSGPASFNMQREGLMPKEEVLEIGKQQKRLKIGIPKEDHELESRVPLTPEAVGILTDNDHEVILERGAGKASNYSDTDYSERGGFISDSRRQVSRPSVVSLPNEAYSVSTERGEQWRL